VFILVIRNRTVGGIGSDRNNGDRHDTTFLSSLERSYLTYFPLSVSNVPTSMLLLNLPTSYGITTALSSAQLCVIALRSLDTSYRARAPI
jgi:hypothetical protein